MFLSFVGLWNKGQVWWKRVLRKEKEKIKNDFVALLCSLIREFSPFVSFVYGSHCTVKWVTVGGIMSGKWNKVTFMLLQEKKSVFW